MDGTASFETEQPLEGVPGKVSEMVKSCWRAPSSGGSAEVKVALHVLFIDDYLAFCFNIIQSLDGLTCMILVTVQSLP